MKNKIAKYALFALDLLIIVFAFLFAAKVRPGTKRIILTYYRSFVPFALIWLGSGLWGQKYNVKTISGGADYVKRIFKCNLIAIAFLFGLMYLFGKFYYSRYIVFGTISISFVLELFFYPGVFYAFRFQKENESYASTNLVTHSRAMENLQSPKFFLDSANAVPIISNEPYHLLFSENIDSDSILIPLWQQYLAEQPKLFEFLNDYLDLGKFNKNSALILNSEDYFNIQNEAKSSRQIFINLHKINDLRRLNYYLIRVNE